MKTIAYTSECSMSKNRMGIPETPCELISIPNPINCSGCPFWTGILVTNEDNEIRKTERWTIVQRNKGIPLGDW